MALDYQIGNTLVGMVTLSSLGIDDPTVVPVHSANTEMLGDGNQRGVGWSQGEWRFHMLDQDEFAALRPYCPEPGLSSDIYIKTVKTGGGMQVYSGLILWPQIEQTGADDCFMDVTIRFIALVEETGT